MAELDFREIERFLARGSDGKVYTVIVSQTPMRRLPRMGGHGTGVQLPQESYRTPDGQHVLPLDDGRYQLRDTDIILTRIDSTADDQF